jgi:hypothetical protein
MRLSSADNRSTLQAMVEEIKCLNVNNVFSIIGISICFNQELLPIRSPVFFFFLYNLLLCVEVKIHHFLPWAEDCTLVD